MINHNQLIDNLCLFWYFISQISPFYRDLYKGQNEENFKKIHGVSCNPHCLPLFRGLFFLIHVISRIGKSYLCFTRENDTSGNW